MIVADPSTDQQAALDAIRAWRDSNPTGSRQCFRLAGHAGTGKSTVISFLHGEWENVAVGTFAGKAAYVLQEKGVPAQTLHSLIYRPRKDFSGHIVHRRRPRLNGVKTIIVDEASMVDHVLDADIRSFRIPVLYVGDPGQLQPIGTDACIMHSPDFCLREIHRQDANSPILKLATDFREGHPTQRWQSPCGRLRIAESHEFWKLLSPEFQMICGFNKTRDEVNRQIRKQLGLLGKVAAGDKLVCLDNNPYWSLFNGQQVHVLGVDRERNGVADVEIEPDGGLPFVVPCLLEQFGNEHIKTFRSKRVVQFDYAYCLTTHKAQGSEFDSVLVLEEISTKWDARRWRYTTSTRAKRRLIYCASSIQEEWSW
jgi:exodeoxyribonuclease-5